MTRPSADGMPTTQETSFYLADPNLAFVGAGAMWPEDLERACPHLAEPSEAGEITCRRNFPGRPRSNGA